MEKYDDRLDGYSQSEYDKLAQAYSAQNSDELNGVLIENAQFLDVRKTNAPFNENNFSYSAVQPEQSENGAKDETKPLKDNVVVPTPQVSYMGLNDNERKWLNDLVLDLKQYYNNDYGLSEFLDGETQEIERPILYFVSKNKMLSKIVNLLCSIFDKSHLNKDLNSLVLALISLSKVVNSK